MLKNVDSGWIHYKNTELSDDLVDDKTGKWMYYFCGYSDMSRIDEVARSVIENDIVTECKYTNPDRFDHDKYIKSQIDFYTEVIKNQYKHKSADELKLLIEKELDEIKPHFEQEFASQYKSGGLMCFYLNIDDFERHKKLLEFMIEKELIKRCKDGSLNNISFKLDSQTRNGDYEKKFNGVLKLEKLVDLKSGKWIYKCK